MKISIIPLFDRTVEIKIRTNTPDHGGCRGVFDNGACGGGDRDETLTAKGVGGNETRPKNISIYYYIKIN